MIKVKKTNNYEDSVNIVYNNNIDLLSSTFFGAGILIEQTVGAGFEGTDPATWTTLPCQRNVFELNTLTRVAIAGGAERIFAFSCLTSAGAVFETGLSTNDLIAEMTLPTQTTFTYTYDTISLAIDQTYNLIFKQNTITDNLGAILNPLYKIEGFVSILISDNVMQNNARHFTNYLISANSLLYANGPAAFESVDSACAVGTVTSDTYGFMQIIKGHHADIRNNSVTNHAFTFGTINDVSTYASFVYFTNFYGNVNIDGLTVSEITGIRGTYNEGTLQSVSSLSTFNADIDAYQAVPVITTDGTNIIKNFTMNDITFDNSIGNYKQNNFAGLFAHFPYSITTGKNDVENLVVTQFRSNNVYNYGQGSLIHKYGHFTIDNVNITGYGSTQPEADASVTETASIVSLLRPDHV